MILAMPAVGSLAGPAGRIIVQPPPLPITVISLTATQVVWSYQPDPLFAGYHVRWVPTPGMPWDNPGATDLDPTGLRASAFVNLSQVPAAAVELLVKPQDLNGLEAVQEARVSVLVQPPPNAIPLAPDATVAWLRQKTDASAATTQHAGDLELTGSATGGVGEVTLAQYAPGFVLDVDYEPLDGNTSSAGVFAQVDFYYLTGANPNVASLGAAVNPSDTGYQALGVRGVRVSIDTKNSASPSLSDQIRWRAMTSSGMSPNLALAPGEVQQTFAFPRGSGPSHLTITVPGDDTLRIDVKWPDGSTTTQKWQDAFAASWINAAGVNIALFTSALRDAKWSNAVLTPLSPPPPPGGSEGMAAPFPQPASASHVRPATASNFTSVLAAANPGDTVLVAPGFSFGGNVVPSAGGTKGSGTDLQPDNPIIVRVGTLAADGKTIVDPSNLPAATIGGGVNPKTSANYVWFRGFTIQGGANVPKGLVGFRFNRCRFTKVNLNDTGTSTSFDWCELDAIADEFLTHWPSSGCRTPFVYRCYFHNQQGDTGNFGTFHSIGRGKGDDGVNCGGRVYENLYGHGVTAGEGGELKTSGSVIWRCSGQDVGGVGGKKQIPRNVVRHGSNNYILACYTEATGVEGCIGCRGDGNVIADCVAPNGGLCGPFSGNETYAQFLAGNSGYPRGENTVVCRVNNPSVGGGPSSGSMPPVGTILEDCTGTPRLFDGAASPQRRNNTTDYYAMHGLPSPTSKPARSWPPSKMGPNAVWSAAD